MIDPWTGEEKQVEQRAISRAVKRVKRLKFTPVLIAKRSKS